MKTESIIKTKKTKILLKLILFGCSFALFFLKNNLISNAKEPTVIVIDPGHGGDNLGALYDGFIEKDMTLNVALKMQERLEQYEGVEVYLTRETDVDLSLEDRILFAKAKNADYFICLHFNMSIHHFLYGAEVWVPSKGELYSRGYSLANEFLTQFEAIGLFNRGIKTKLNNDGNDYYGILRHAVEEDIPAILVEHCHYDNLTDRNFYMTDGALNQLAAIDADSVARYFQLSSTILAIDNSNYKSIEIPVPETTSLPDLTPPQNCYIENLSYNQELGNLEFSVSASDLESGLLYYQYSYDGGNLWSQLIPWEKGKEKISFSFSIKEGTSPSVCVKVYNGYDLTTTSDICTLEKYVVANETIVNSPLSKDNISYTVANEEVTIINKFQTFLVLFIVSFSIFVILMVVKKYFVVAKKRHKKHKKKLISG